MKIVRLLLATAMLLTASAHAADDGDRQTWNFVSIKYLDTAKFDLVVVGQFRFRDDFSEFSHATISQRLQFDPRPWLGLSLN